MSLLFYELASGVTRRRGWQQIRQRTWQRISVDLPRVPEGSTTPLSGFWACQPMWSWIWSTARFKYHWIRSDTRVLGRDEQIDAAYYARLTGAVSVSAQCAEIFAGMYSGMKDRIAVYKNDIPDVMEELSQGLGPVANGFPLILTVSRLDRLKGIDLAIEACADLVSRGHRVTWVALGEGRQREALERLVEAHGLHDVFLLPGSTLATHAYLDLADIYVHPSRTEGRSNAVEEARACGKAIVATAYQTVAEQVRDGVTGIVCPVDAASIADCVEHFWSIPGLLRGSVGRRNVPTLMKPATPMFCLSA